MENLPFHRAMSTAAALLILQFISLQIISLQIISPQAFAEQPSIGAPEVPVVNSDDSASTPTPIPCTNPTAKVSGNCPSGTVEIGTICPQAPTESRCIIPPPDYSPTTKTIYLPDCTANDANSCAPCIWKQPSCSAFAKYTWSDIGYYADMTQFAVPDPTKANPLINLTKGASSCTVALAKKAVADAYAYTKGDRYFDDWIYFKLLYAFGVDPNNFQSASVNCTKVGGSSYGHYNGRCLKGEIFFDATTCQAVPIRAVKDICGDVVTWLKDMLFASSPISLLWNAGVDIESDVSLVQFPLDPRHPENWYLWKASGVAPLVVFDPQHTGHIDSANQLFGQWTFGGRKLATNIVSPKMVPQEAPWRNGYEALQSLDSNADQMLSGAELEPIALWFDKNQDGISQPGEVLSARSLGLTKIFTLPSDTDAMTGNITAALGFERKTPDGRIYQSASVDWFSKGAATPFELFAEHHLRKVNITLADLPPPVLPSTKEVPHGAINSHTNLSGVWNWRFNDTRIKSKRSDVQGVLILKQDNTGAIEGISLSELSVKENSRRIGSLASFNLLQGGITLTSAGEKTNSFKIVENESQSAESEVRLTPDGKTLEGVTTEILQREGQSPLKVRYSWTAERVSREP